MVRKKMSVKCLIYCTKAKPYLYHEGTEKWWFNEGVLEPFAYIEGYDLYKEKQKEMSNIDSGDVRKTIYKCLNGKIVAQFDCEKVEEIRMLQDNNMTYETKTLIEEQLLIKSRLEGYQLGNYLGLLYENECGYALHLSNIKVFDKPLSFKTDYIYKDYKTNAILTKAPQNMCNVYDRFGNHYVLISIRPEYVAKILNGEKTIEVRRKILNCLKDLI